jgi:hypothetical protein
MMAVVKNEEMKNGGIELDEYNDKYSLKPVWQSQEGEWKYNWVAKVSYGKVETKSDGKPKALPEGIYLGSRDNAMHILKALLDSLDLQGAFGTSTGVDDDNTPF